MNRVAPPRRPLGAITPYLFAAATAGCSDSATTADENLGTTSTPSTATGHGTTSTPSTATSHGDPTISSVLTASSSGISSSGMAAANSLTGSVSASSSGLASTGTGGAASTESTSSGSGVTSAGGATGTGGAGGSGGGPNQCPELPPLVGGQEYCDKELKQDMGNGYSFEIWSEQMGSGCMTVYGQEAAFGASWSNVEDFLARVGLNFDQTQTHQQIGNIVADFAHTLTEEGGGLTYVGIYGWTVDPLVEYYILDDWGETKPAGTASDGTPRTEEGTITVDGATYDVWSKFRENKPSIVGDADFYQYFSIRETARKCGRISVSEHFRQWEELGIDLGKFHEVKWLAESQNNSGSIEFTKATVVVE